MPAVQAFAAGITEKGPSEFIFLIQIVVLVGLGRLLGEGMQRIGQPTVMGQLLAGILLGPSGLGALWPAGQHYLFPAAPEQKAMIDGLAQFGVLLLLLLAGMETDLKLVRRIGRAAASVSIAGICLPFACGFALGQVLPASLLPDPQERVMASLLLGTALSISSVKIVAIVVREMNFMRRNVGQIILASAVIDDTIGWIIIAITFSLARHGSLDAGSLAQSILGTLAFLVISLTVGRRLVFPLIRWTNDNFRSELPVISLILVLMGVLAMITHAIGVHTVLGAFVAGILIGESPILTRQIDQQLRGLITALFAPVFFGLAGLSADLTILHQPDLLLLTVGLIAIATVGKFSGAFIGGTLGGMSQGESLALASGMNARGSTEVIVATIGLSAGLLSQNLYTMILTMAVVTTLAMPPMLRWSLSRLPLSEAERVRLSREEIEASGFLSTVERLLLAVDRSPTGRFTSRLTGMIAGARGIPITVLHLADDDAMPARLTAGRAAGRATPESALADGANVAARATGEPHALVPERIAVRNMQNTAAAMERAVAAEAGKGYDLLLVGLETMTAPDGGFHDQVSQIAASFNGPLLTVVARGDHLERPATSGFKILLPVSGTAVSTRAAELAIAIARANNASLTALYVAATTKGERAAAGQAAETMATLPQEEAFLKDIVDLAERYNVVMRTAIRGHGEPHKAILREARRGGYNLIIMGVNRRQGDALFFGNVPGAVLDQAQASLIFLAS